MMTDISTPSSKIGLPASTEEDPVIWAHATVHCNPSQQQHVETALEKAGSLAITLADGADTPIFEPLPGETPLWPALTISGLFELPANKKRQHRKLKAIQNQLSAALNGAEIVLSLFEDEEWVRTCLQDFVPIHVAKNMWIVPSWHSPPVGAEIALRLDPGLAFGTGTHPTTMLCLQWLAEIETRIKQARVLDYGCGSGILGIGAALLGASHVDATDIDGQALLSTRMNGEKNQVSINTCRPESLRQTKNQYNIIVANILAEPLLQLAEHIASLVKPGGAICLSGLLESQQNQMIRAYTPHFHSFQLASLDGWGRVVAIRHTS